MKLDIDISVVIPVLDDPESAENVLYCLNDQTLLPKEVILVDSSANEDIKRLINEIDLQIPIVYKRVGKAFPYEATNIGADMAKSEWLAFLDATTIPRRSWLQDYANIIKDKKVEVVFGVTEYIAETKLQELIRASTYGGIGHETAPGSLMRKKDFIDSGKIIEGVRSGGDIEWKNRLKILGYKCFTPNKIYLTYSELPTNLFDALKKFFIYQLHGAKLNVQNNVKNVYLGLLLLFSAIIIPKWNALVGWEASPLYMPNITKIYLSALVVLSIGLLFVNKVLLNRLSGTFFSNMLKSALLISLFFVFFRWNEVIAGWVEDSVWYIPNITKIYLGSILLASVLYRGLYFPLKNKVEKAYLFPFRWLQVGVVGLLLDLAKSPGYLIGSILIPYKKVSKTKD